MHWIGYGWKDADAYKNPTSRQMSAHLEQTKGPAKHVPIAVRGGLSSVSRYSGEHLGLSSLESMGSKGIYWGVFYRV